MEELYKVIEDNTMKRLDEISYSKKANYMFERLKLAMNCENIKDLILEMLDDETKKQILNGTENLNDEELMEYLFYKSILPEKVIDEIIETHRNTVEGCGEEIEF